MDTVARRLSRFSGCHDLANLRIWRRQAGVMENNEEIREDSLSAIKLFTMYAHERAGRNPKFPHFHRVAIIRALKGRTFDEALFQDDRFASKVWKEFVRLSNDKPNKQNTEGVVRDVLTELRKEGEANLVLFLASKRPEEAFEWLDSVRGIGEKIAALIVRDFGSILSLWGPIPDDKLHYLQPLDVWSRFWSRRCWNSMQHRTVMPEMKEVTARCLDEGVDPIKFNKGAWLVGRHFYEIRRFFNVGESSRDPPEECLKKFDAVRLENSIRTYADLLDRGEVFGV